MEHYSKEKLVRINLTNGKILFEDVRNLQEWIGGIGVGEKILYDEVKATVQPYDPENKIIFSTGVVTGLPFPGAGRLAAVTKSPMTMGIASSNAGGHFAAELKYAGIGHLAIEGYSPKPVFVCIEDDNVEIKDASMLTGKNAWETNNILNNKLGKDFKILSIGQAGENLVRFACIAVEKHRFLGRNGFGAVMGSKNLKAIAVRGSGYVDVFDPKGYFELTNEIYDRLSKNTVMQRFIKWGALAGSEGKYRVGGYSYKHSQDLHISKEMFDGISIKTARKYRQYQSSCTGCIMGCYSRYKVAEGQYKGLDVEGVQFNSALDFGSKLGIPDFKFCMKATALCNSMGLDIDCTSETIAWLMECYEKGIITGKEIGNIKPRFGDKRMVLELIEKIALRKGIGDVLAEGVARASAYFTSDASYYAMHIKGNDLYEVMRSQIGYALGAAVTTRGGTHTLGSPLIESFIIEDKKLAMEKFGVNTFSDPLTYEGKPEIVKYYEILTRMCSCIGMCLFASDWQEIHMLDSEDLTRLLNVTTGFNYSVGEFKKKMLALLNMEKAFNYLHAGFTRKDDYPPKRLMKETVKSGPAKGAFIDEQEWNKMLDIYYDIHGCDKTTGLPTKRTLKDLELDFVLDELSETDNVCIE